MLRFAPPRRNAVAALILSTVSLAHVSAHADDHAPTEDESAFPVDEVIVVTGTRSATTLSAAPIATQVISRRQLDESGATTVADVLAQQPGLWIDRGVGGAGVGMQGLGPKHVLVLIDGQRQLGRVDGVLDLDRLGLASVEQIEIVRGPSSALYGADALGGVVNVITRKPKGTEVEALVQVSHRGAADLRGRVGGVLGPVTAALDASYRRADALQATSESPSTMISGYSDPRVAATARYSLGERTRFELTGDYERRDLRGIDALGTGAVFDRHNRTETGGVRLNASWQDYRTLVESNVAVQTYRDQYLYDQRGSAALDKYEETVQQQLTVQAQVTRSIGTQHRVGVGAEVLGETLDTARLREPGDRLRSGLFVQDEWSLADGSVQLVPAVRFDLDSQFGAHATPRLAARWDASKRLVVRSSVGIGYRAPDFKELLLRFENPGVGYVVDGNPDLAPESSLNVQLGAELQVSDQLRVSVNGFNNELVDLISAVSVDDTAPDMLMFSYDNIGRARSTGVEASLLASVGRLSLEAGYAFTRSRDLDLNRALEGLPTQRATARVRWADEEQGLTALVEMSVTGKRPYYLDEDMTVDAERRYELRLRIGKRFGRGYGAFMGGDNLFSTGDVALDRLAPATLYAGVELTR